MKYSKLLFLPFLALLACSKHESKPAIENASLSLNSGTTIQVPAGLTSSTNSYAEMAAGYVSMANGITGYSSMFKIPAGATKLSAPLVATNGRVSASTTVTYTWADAYYGTLGYQVTDNGDSYSFELYVKYKGTDKWLRYLIGYEKKDLSIGSLKVLDTSSDPSPIYYQYDWVRNGDTFTFTLTFPSQDYKFVITVNTKTKAGSVNYYASAKLEYHMEWGSDGKGSYVFYNTDNNSVIDSGSW